MAEAVGLATGLLGGCDVILRSTTAIIQYISDVKDAAKELDKLRNEVESLEAVVGAVKGFLNSSKARRQLGPAKSMPINPLLDKCERVVKALEDEFKRYAGSTRSRFLCE